MGMRGHNLVTNEYTHDRLAINSCRSDGEEGQESSSSINHYAGSPEMGMEFRPYYIERTRQERGMM